MGPFYKDGHPNPAFKQRDLPAAIGLVDLRKPQISGTAIVAGEDDDRVFRQAFLFELVHDATNAAIDRAQHGGIDAKPMRLDISNRFIISLGRLQRCVHAPMSEIEEEWTVLVRFDDFQAFIGPVIGQIAARLKKLTTIVRRGELRDCPERFVDRIEVEFCVDDIGIVFRQEEQVFHEQTFVKALRRGMKFTD